MCLIGTFYPFPGISESQVESRSAYLISSQHDIPEHGIYFSRNCGQCWSARAPSSRHLAPPPSSRTSGQCENCAQRAGVYLFFNHPRKSQQQRGLHRALSSILKLNLSPVTNRLLRTYLFSVCHHVYPLLSVKYTSTSKLHTIFQQGIAAFFMRGIWMRWDQLMMYFEP